MFSLTWMLISQLDHPTRKDIYYLHHIYLYPHLFRRNSGLPWIWCQRRASAIHSLKDQGFAFALYVNDMEARCVLVYAILSVELARPTFSSLLLRHSWNALMLQVACDRRLSAEYTSLWLLLLIQLNLKIPHWRFRRSVGYTFWYSDIVGMIFTSISISGRNHVTVVAWVGDSLLSCFRCDLKLVRCTSVLTRFETEQAEVRRLSRLRTHFVTPA